MGSFCPRFPSERVGAFFFNYELTLLYRSCQRDRLGSEAGLALDAIAARGKSFPALPTLAIWLLLSLRYEGALGAVSIRIACGEG
jgi:hypothetical protein